jgi:hypothetical protein
MLICWSFFAHRGNLRRLDFNVMVLLVLVTRDDVVLADFIAVDFADFLVSDTSAAAAVNLMKTNLAVTRDSGVVCANGNGNQTELEEALPGMTHGHDCTF